MRKVSVIAITLIALFALNQKAEALHWPHKSSAPAAGAPASSGSNEKDLLASLGEHANDPEASKAALVAHFGEGIGEYAMTKDPTKLPPNLQQPISVMCNNVCGMFTCGRYHNVGLGCKVLCPENEIQHCISAMGQ